MEHRICIIGASQSEADFIVSTLSEAGYMVEPFLSVDQIMNEDISRYDVFIIRADFADKGRDWELAKQIRSFLSKNHVGIILLADSLDMPFLRQMNRQDANSMQIYDEILFFPLSHEELLGNIERVKDIINKKQQI